ncbi:MAG: hypothetical protein QXK89_03405 [Candidatus Bathyarchaeia archaeon]
MRRYACLVLIALLTLPYYSIERLFTTQLTVTIKSTSITRIVPITIKVILIGPYFVPEIIDPTMLEALLPREKSGRILMDENNTGVVYKFNYEFVFASQSFRTKLIKFLMSIEEERELENPWFYTFAFEEEWFVSKPTRVMASIYDARVVERWLIKNLGDLGGLPENGYTFIIADLRDLPSISYEEIRAFLEARTLGITPPRVKTHYYRVDYMDSDRGYKLRFREFAVGWGGSERLWFIDLSAGPTFVSMWYDLPIQVIMRDQSINPYTNSGASWLTELLADHVWEFIYNLATPDFVYDPPWSEKFIVNIVIVDCRDELEKSVVPVKSTVNLTLIREVVSSLLPFSEVKVEIIFLNITSLPDLCTLIDKYSGNLDSWIHKYLFLSSMNISYVDAQPVYEYLRYNLNLLLPNVTESEGEYAIPIIAFAFSQDKHFMFKYKWLITRLSPETSAIWGVSFREFALIGLSQKDFLYGEYVEPKQEGKGFGFTQVIIHEVGHMLGLAHPHTYGDLGNFVSSAMSYFSYEYGFSIFDKDALARVHADKLLMKAYKEIMEVREKLPLKFGLEEIKEIKDLMNNTEKLLSEADNKYLRMNYVDAWKIALEAYRMAHEILEIVNALPSIPEDVMAEIEEKDLEIARLNKNYSMLKTRYEELMNNYSKLSLEYEGLSLKHEMYFNELQFFKSLAIFLAITNILTAIIIIYFMKRKRKIP